MFTKWISIIVCLSWPTFFVMSGCTMYVCVHTYALYFFQTIYLSASVGSTAKQQLPLKNAGNIGVHLKVKVGWLLPLEIMSSVTLVLY